MVSTKVEILIAAWGGLLLEMIITAMVEQNAGGEREHTKKEHGRRIKAGEKRQKVVLEQVYCLKGKKILNKC